MKKDKKTTKELVYEYFCKGIMLSSELSKIQNKTIFLLALRDFFKDRADIDVLNMVSNDLLYGLTKTPTNVFLQDSELGGMLEKAAEIKYLKEDKEEVSKTKPKYEKYIEELKNYYEENQELIT